MSVLQHTESSVELVWEMDLYLFVLMVFYSFDIIYPCACKYGYIQLVL